MNVKAATLTATVVAALGAFLLVYFGPPRWTKTEAFVGAGPSSAKIARESSPSHQGETIREAPLREEADASEEPMLEPSDPAVEVPIGDTRMVQNLRGAIEETVYERLDPSAVLDAALHVVELEPDSEAVPFPDGFGDLRFAVSGMPDGLSADFVVGRVSNPKIGSVLSLEIRAKEPFSPYLIEGAVRAEPTVTIKVWTDPEGNPTALGIHSSLRPTSETLALGMPIEGANITQGIGYTLNLTDMSDSMSAYGVKGGEFATWQVPVTLGGSAWPRGDDIERLSKRLMKNYSDIQTAYSQRNPTK